MRHVPSVIGLLLGVLQAPLASAQVATTLKGLPPDPLDPQAPVPALHHRSSLAAYPRQAEPAVGEWREANERVHRIGGWRVYAREAAAPSPAPASAPPPASPSTPSPHRHEGR